MNRTCAIAKLGDEQFRREDERKNDDPEGSGLERSGFSRFSRLARLSACSPDRHQARAAREAGAARRQQEEDAVQLGCILDIDRPPPAATNPLSETSQRRRGTGERIRVASARRNSILPSARAAVSSVNPGVWGDEEKLPYEPPPSGRSPSPSAPLPFRPPSASPSAHSQ